MNSIDELIQTTATLRSPNGCPWDREQTHESLKKYLIEEVYEVLEAIDKNSTADLLEELGDLLFQICIHSQIEAEKGHFDFSDVADRINQKMISRHPHVFGEVDNIDSAAEVVHQWEKIKASEKPKANSPFESIPAHLPSLMRAVKVLKKAEKLNLNTQETDWRGDSQVMPDPNRYKSLLSEVKTDKDLGELLLVIVEHSKNLRLDPEETLRQTVAKIQKEFEKRVQSS